MSLLVIILLILVGITLILAEIFILTGTIIPGIIGLGLMAGGVWLTYQNHGTETGNYMLIGTAAVFVIIVTISLRSNTWQRMSLQANIDGKVNVNEVKIKAGDEGESVSRLAPTGKVLIKNNTYEARSINEYIAPHSPVVVVSVNGNQIIVKQIKR